MYALLSLSCPGKVCFLMLGSIVYSKKVVHSFSWTTRTLIVFLINKIVHVRVTSENNWVIIKPNALFFSLSVLFVVYNAITYSNGRALLHYESHVQSCPYKKKEYTEICSLIYFLKMDFRSKSKKSIFICTSYPHSAYDSMALWKI